MIISFITNDIYSLFLFFFNVLHRSSHVYIWSGFIPSVVWRLSYFSGSFTNKKLALPRDFLYLWHRLPYLEQIWLQYMSGGYIQRDISTFRGPLVHLGAVVMSIKLSECLQGLPVGLFYIYGCYKFLGVARVKCCPLHPLVLKTITIPYSS